MKVTNSMLKVQEKETNRLLDEAALTENALEWFDKQVAELDAMIASLPTRTTVKKEVRENEHTYVTA